MYLWPQNAPDTSRCTPCITRSTASGLVPEWSVAGQGRCQETCPRDYGIFDDDVKAENGQRAVAGATQVMERACSFCPDGKFYTNEAAGEHARAGVCLLCSPERLCKGGHSCAPGYTGYLCMKCYKGYHMVDKNICDKCQSITAPTIAMAVVVLLCCWRAVLLLWRALQKAKRNRVNYFAWLTTLQKFSLIVSYMQVSQITVSLPLEWPQVLVRFWTYVGCWAAGRSP